MQRKFSFHKISRIPDELKKIYFNLLPCRSIPIDDLIYPHRLDIQLRVDFLKDYLIAGNMEKANRSEYYQFLKNLNKHPYYIKAIDEDKMIEKFAKLFYSIRDEGLDQKKYEPIKIERVKKKMRFEYPDNGKIIEGIRSNHKYILREGAHRIAILKVLNYNKVQCKIIYTGKQSTSDYSTFIRNYNDKSSS